MPDRVFNILIYLISFFVIWAGSGLIVSSVNKLSHRLHIPIFFISFVILGFLTSIPEIAVGLSSVSSNNPGIFVGNLLGGIPIIYLLIIPLLAIFGNGIKLSNSLSKGSIVLSLITAISPFLVVLDGKVNNFEGLALIAVYLVVVVILQKSSGVFRGKNSNFFTIKSYSFFDIIKILVGTGLVLVSSNIIVSKTFYFSQEFNVAPFYISLIVLSLGTNLPEITLAIRSVFSGRKDIAFGDYLGSACVNVFLFGLFTIMTPTPVLHVDNFLTMFIIVAIGLFLFYQFSKTKHTISQKEGFILLLVYIIFVVVELLPR